MCIQSCRCGHRSRAVEDPCRNIRNWVSAEASLSSHWERRCILRDPRSEASLSPHRVFRRNGLGLATALTLGVAGIVIGVAIGSTGIGGVLLVPFLIYALGMSAPLAVALALFSFLWSGLVAAGLYARHGSIAWREAAWLSL